MGSVFLRFVIAKTKLLLLTKPITKSVSRILTFSLD
jgi:hypothetical protein